MALNSFLCADVLLSTYTLTNALDLGDDQLRYLFKSVQYQFLQHCVGVFDGYIKVAR